MTEFPKNPIFDMWGNPDYKPPEVSDADFDDIVAQAPHPLDGEEQAHLRERLNFTCGYYYFECALASRPRTDDWKEALGRISQAAHALLLACGATDGLSVPPALKFLVGERISNADAAARISPGIAARQLAAMGLPPQLRLQEIINGVATLGMAADISAEQLVGEPKHSKYTGDEEITATLFQLDRIYRDTFNLAPTATRQGAFAQFASACLIAFGASPNKVRPEALAQRWDTKVKLISGDI